jgi:hypothetical protein
MVKEFSHYAQPFANHCLTRQLAIREYQFLHVDISFVVKLLLHRCHSYVGLPRRRSSRNTLAVFLHCAV